MADREHEGQFVLEQVLDTHMRLTDEGYELVQVDDAVSAATANGAPVRKTITFAYAQTAMLDAENIERPN